jgi:hypothetical protein
MVFYLEKGKVATQATPAPALGVASDVKMAAK